VASALRVNTALTSLVVGGGGITPFTEEGALSIVRIERQPNKLTSLRLACCGIGPTGAAEIAEYVFGSRVLKTLDLRDNELCGIDSIGQGTYSAVGITALAEALEVNGVLKELDLKGNHISDEGAKAIGEALRVNARLTNLDLSDNNIGDEGAKAIGEALAVNARLTNWKGILRSNLAKYGKARELEKHLGRIRADYMKGMKNPDMESQQLAVAVYLIDRLALRAVSCTSLRVEHVFLDEGDNKLRLNSIEYDATTGIIPEAYKALKSFVTKKKPGDQVFDQVNLAELDDYFKIFMEGLSAKVFYTYNASITLDAELRKTEQMVSAKQRAAEGDVVNKVLTTLGLDNNNIGPEGAAAIAEALRGNGLLKNIDLSSNNLGDEGKGVIQDAVSGREGFKLYV